MGNTELRIGLTEGTILGHDIRKLGDKTAVVFDAETDYGADCQVLVFLTAKSMGIARAQLRIAGFDMDALPLRTLNDEGSHLAGNKLPLIVEEYNGKLRAQINLRSKPSVSEMDALTASLRAAKKDNESAPEPAGGDDIPF